MASNSSTSLFKHKMSHLSTSAINFRAKKVTKIRHGYMYPIGTYNYGTFLGKILYFKALKIFDLTMYLFPIMS